MRAINSTEPEGLDDVVVGADLETNHPIDLLALGGHHDDRYCRAAAQLATEGEPVHVRQAEVEEDEIRLDRLERIRTRRHSLDLESLAAKSLHEWIRDRVLVLDEQQLHSSSVPSVLRDRLGGNPHPGGC